MLCVRANKLENNLKSLALQTGKSKSFIVRVALKMLFKQVEKNPVILSVSEEENIDRYLEQQRPVAMSLFG